MSRELPSIPKRILGVLSILLVSVSLLVAVDVGYDVKLLATTAPELKVEAGAALTIPMLQGEGMLVKGNNLKVKGRVSLSPISTTASVEAVLTPIAFFELSLGGTLGGGWDLSSSLKGLQFISAANTPLIEESGSFEALYLKGKVGAALQFDTAAFFSSPWASVFARTYHEFSLQSVSNVNSGSAWNFEKGGYRGNGGFYHAEYIVGYNMPIFLDKVALMLETDWYNVYDFMATDLLLTFSPILNFKIMKSLNLTAIVQFSNKLPYAGIQQIMADNAVQAGALKFSKAVGMLTYTF